MRKASRWVFEGGSVSKDGTQLDQRTAKDKMMIWKKKAILIPMSVPK